MNQSGWTPIYEWTFTVINRGVTTAEFPTAACEGLYAEGGYSGNGNAGNATELFGLFKLFGVGGGGLQQHVHIHVFRALHTFSQYPTQPPHG
jgi:hypothetical protein